MSNARISPSGRNAQDLRFILIANSAVNERIFENIRWAKRNGEPWRPAPDQRPTAYIAILAPEKSSELIKYDAGIACQTMQLAAASKGWGCCVVYAFNHANIRETLDMPHGFLPILLLALGVCAQKSAVEDMAAGAGFACRDEDGVHIVPKRPLEELVLKRID